MSEELQIAELIGEVRKLEGTNSANARLLREVQTDVVNLDTRLAVNTAELRKRARNTLLLVLCVAVLLAGLAVGGIYAAKYFSCRNDSTQKFLAAEHDKVAGQIRGIDQMFQDPRAGIAQFKGASQHYLDTIARINNNC